MAPKERLAWCLGGAAWLLVSGILISVVPAHLQPPLITSFAAVTAMAVSVRTVIWQISKQAKNADLTNEENEKRKLKLSIYSDLTECSRTARKAQTEFAALIGSITQGVKTVKIMSGLGYDYRIPGANLERLSAAHEKLTSQLSVLMGEIERWGVVDPRILVFNLAFTVCTVRLANRISRFYLLIQRVDGDVTAAEKTGSPIVALPEKELGELEASSSQLLDFLWELLGFLIDFDNEMQNLLVGKLFGAEIPVRVPRSKAPTIVRLADHAELSEKFRSALK